MPDAPSNVEITSRSLHGLTWSWDAYETEYEPAWHVEWRNVGSETNNNGGGFFGTGTFGAFAPVGLDDSTEYEMRVRAVIGPDSGQPDGFAYSDWTDWVPGKTKGEDGDQPDTTVYGTPAMEGTVSPGQQQIAWRATPATGRTIVGGEWRLNGGIGWNPGTGAEGWTPISAYMTWEEYTTDPGEYTFEIRAIDDEGNVDPSPLTVNWTVVV